MLTLPNCFIFAFPFFLSLSAPCRGLEETLLGNITDDSSKTSVVMGIREHNSDFI